MSPLAKLKIVVRAESGMTLVETAVALAILGTIAVTFLTGLAVTSRAAFISDEQATAETVAQSQLEWVKTASYNATGYYPPAPLPDGKDYTNYSANITAQSLNTPDNGIQKITVTVIRSGKQVFSLEGYKVDR